MYSSNCTTEWITEQNSTCKTMLENEKYIHSLGHLYNIFFPFSVFGPIYLDWPMRSRKLSSSQHITSKKLDRPQSSALCEMDIFLPKIDPMSSWSSTLSRLWRMFSSSSASGRALAATLEYLMEVTGWPAHSPATSRVEWVAWGWPTRAKRGPKGLWCIQELQLS